MTYNNQIKVIYRGFVLVSSFILSKKINNLLLFWTKVRSVMVLSGGFCFIKK